MSPTRAPLFGAFLLALALSAACDDPADADDERAGSCLPGAAVPGVLTTYASPGAGAATCQPATLPDHHAAVSARIGAAACGTCLEVFGPRGSAIALVVDVCPNCAADALQVSLATWLAVTDAPVATVTWRTVACPAGGPIRYRSCSATTPSFLCVIVDDHRFALAAVEVQPAGAASFVALARDGSNQWSHVFGAAAEPPFTIRATDVHGHVLTDTFSGLAAGTVALGAADFPETCP